MIALGTYYSEGKVGEIYVITLENGTVIYCVTGDIKDDADTDSMHQYRLDETDMSNANIVEFILDTDSDALSDKLEKGNVGWMYPELSSDVVEIRKLDIPSLVSME